MKAKTLRFSLALIACGLVVTVLLGRLPSKEAWASTVTNTAHGPVFAVITIIVLILGHQSEFGRRRLLRGCLIAVVFAVILGAVIELMQSMLGGDAELQDVVNDMVGAIAGAALFVFAIELSNKESPSVTLRRAALFSSIAATAFIAAPVATMGAAYWARDARFPVLFDAGTVLATQFVHAYDGSSAEVQRLPMSEQDGLRVRPGTIFPWGLAFFGTYPDWRGKRFFAVQLVNPTNNPLSLQLRIYDKLHGGGRPYGFYTPLLLAPHSSLIKRLPLAELAAAADIQHVDLAAVGGIVLYGDRDNHAQEFYVLKMWLE